jgi:hypothetical protein
MTINEREQVAAFVCCMALSGLTIVPLFHILFIGS